MPPTYAPSHWWVIGIRCVETKRNAKTSDSALVCRILTSHCPKLCVAKFTVKFYTIHCLHYLFRLSRGTKRIPWVETVCKVSVKYPFYKRWATLVASSFTRNTEGIGLTPARATNLTKALLYRNHTVIGIIFLYGTRAGGTSILCCPTPFPLSGGGRAGAGCPVKKVVPLTRGRK